MSRCSVCDYDNTYGALICARCYNLLVPTDMPPADTTLPRRAWPPPPDNATRLWETQPSPVPHAGPDAQIPKSLGPLDMNLIIGDESIIIQVVAPTVLGRYGASTSLQPRIDLNPYGAIDKGVSRMHAALKRTDRGFTVEDLASSNGTWLNETRLQPYTPKALTSGDRIRLSQLMMQIMFKATVR